jgi:hypothetical protein
MGETDRERERTFTASKRFVEKDVKLAAERISFRVKEKITPPESTPVAEETRGRKVMVEEIPGAALRGARSVNRLTWRPAQRTRRTS